MSSYKNIILLFGQLRAAYNLDNLKTEKTCERAVKKFPFIVTCIPDRYKTHIMYNKAILENGGTLKSVPDYYKTKEKICNQGAVNYGHALEFVLDCYKSQKMCNETINISSPTIQFVSKCHNPHEMYVKVDDTCPFVFDSAPD